MMHKEAVSVCLAIGLAFGLQGCGVVKKWAVNELDEWIKDDMYNATEKAKMSAFLDKEVQHWTHEQSVIQMSTKTFLTKTFLNKTTFALLDQTFALLLPLMPLGESCTDAPTCQAMATTARAKKVEADQALVKMKEDLKTLRVGYEKNIPSGGLKFNLKTSLTNSELVSSIEFKKIFVTNFKLSKANQAVCIATHAAAACLQQSGGGVRDQYLMMELGKRVGTCVSDQASVSGLYAINPAITKFIMPRAHASVAGKAANYALVSGGVVGLAAVLTLLVLRIRKVAPTPADQREFALMAGSEEGGEQINSLVLAE